MIINLRSDELETLVSNHIGNVMNIDKTRLSISFVKKGNQVEASIEVLDENNTVVEAVNDYNEETESVNSYIK